MLELTLRLVASLAIVVGLLLLIAKVGGRRMRGRAGSLVQVVHRQQLSRSTSVAVVTVGSRVLVLGTTEQQVSVLTELDPDELDELAEPAADLVLVPGEDDEHGAPTQITVLQPVAPAEAAPAVPVAATESRAGARRATPTRAARSGGARRAAAPRKAAKAPKQAGGRRAAAPAKAAGPANGPLSGSVLSPDTWKQALAAAMGKAS